MKIIKHKRKELEIRAATLIEKKIREYLKAQEQVVLGIPGGTSIQGILGLLKKQNIPWNKVHVFMIDEKLVPLDAPESNFKQAYDLFLEYLTKQKLLPNKNIHPYIYFNQEDKNGAEAYKNELREISHKFDIILLSSGEDGHVGSLFPNHETIKSEEEFFLITKSAPKAPQKRLSASRKLLSRSKTALLLFFSDTKRQAYQNFLSKNLSLIDCPAKLINEIQDSHVFTDLEESKS